MNRLAWVAVAIMMIALYAMRGIAVDRGTELEAATDSIAKLEHYTTQLQTRADSLGSIAHRADTVLVAVTDTVRVEIDRAWDRARASADSLRVTLDSTEAAHLVALENAHADEVAAVWRVADERLAWGESWRTFALTSDSLVQVQRATIAQWSIRDAIMRGEVRKARTQTWATRGIAVAGTLAVLVLK